MEYERQWVHRHGSAARRYSSAFSADTLTTANTGWKTTDLRGEASAGAKTTPADADLSWREIERTTRRDDAGAAARN